MKPRLHLVRSIPHRPLAKLTRAEKLAEAIAWLRSRGKYVLDKDSKPPAWGIPQPGAKK